MLVDYKQAIDVVKNKYMLSKVKVSLIGFFHDTEDYDRWRFVVAGPAIEGDKKSLDQAYDILLETLHDNFYKDIKSINTVKDTSDMATTLAERLSLFNNSVNGDALVPVNVFGIADGYFWLNNELVGSREG